MFGKYLYLLVKRWFQPHCRSFLIDANTWYIMVCWAPKAPSISINLSFALENCHSIWWWLSPTPLKNMWKSVGMMTFPIWKNKTRSKPPTSYFWPPIPRSTDSCRSCSWIATEEQHHQKDGRDQNDLRCHVIAGIFGLRRYLPRIIKAYLWKSNFGEMLWKFCWVHVGWTIQLIAIEPLKGKHVPEQNPAPQSAWCRCPQQLSPEPLPYWRLTTPQNIVLFSSWPRFN